MIKDKSLRNAELGNIALFREHNVSQVSDKTLPACKKPGRLKKLEKVIFQTKK